MKYDPTSAGAYSTSDYGARGDLYAISPATYPVPGYLKYFEDWRKAVNEATDSCKLQQGVCWVLKRDSVLPRCGQRCGRGECENCGPGVCSGGFGALAGHAGQGGYPDAVRREVESAWRPVAQVTSKGVATIKDGCTLPLWQRIFYVGGQNNEFTMAAPGMTYRAAVAAAMAMARDQRRSRIVFGARDGQTVPVVYVEPGGIVRAHQGTQRDYFVNVSRMDELEMRQALAASHGASLMPFNM
jgi:hypothetical protein